MRNVRPGGSVAVVPSAVTVAAPVTTEAAAWEAAAVGPSAVTAATDRSSGARRLAAWSVLVLTALLLVLPAVPADAHAVLLGSTPSAGEALASAPDEVRLSFNEPVTGREGALRVFDRDAQRVDTGPVDGVPASEVAVGLPADLPDGAYVATYRVISADSHPVGGTISFTVGDADALDDDLVAAIAGPGTGAIGTVGSVLRGIGYVGTLLAAGAVIAAVAVARGPADRARAARIGRPAAVLGAVAVLLHLPVQAAAVSGYGLGAVLTDLSLLGETLVSSFGQSWIARFAALLALAMPWFVAGPVAAQPEGSRPRGGTRHPLRWLGAAAALALASYLLDGHQRTVEPAWLLVTGDAIHLAGAATWVGGIAVLVVTLRGTRLDDDPVGGATLVARFSRLALWSVLALTAAGVAMSLPLVRSADALTGTAYGTLLLTKVALVAVIVAIAAYNRQRLVPLIERRAVPAGGSVGTEVDDAAAAAERRAAAGRGAWRTLGGTVAVEAVLLVAVLGVTGFLVTTQPAAEEAGLSGPTMLSEPLTDELTLDFIVTPSAAGLNTIHAYALEPSGQPTTDVEDLRLEFTYVDEDIGPFVVEPFVAGPGHWTATIDDLRFSGSWEVRVVAGIDRFTETELTLPFTIR